MHCCASCGIAGVDDIKLKDCDDCDLVKYCSGKCQEDHRPQHKQACEKRAAELRDEILFKQPECYLGNCPICYLPLPLDPKQLVSMSCCSKQICNGCEHANKIREFEGRLQEKCPFCRKAAPKTDEEVNEQRMKRIEANDPVAMCYMGTERYHEGDYKAAFEYYTKAAALGDVVTHYQLSIMYHREGKGFEKDEKWEQYHKEQAAIGGHPLARHNLGCVEMENGRVDRAVKHYIIATKLGLDLSLEAVRELYRDGFVSKEDFVAALRGYIAAIEATISPQREEAVEFYKEHYERREI